MAADELTPKADKLSFPLYRIKGSHRRVADPEGLGHFYECDHQVCSAPRARTVEGGSPQYRPQCLYCGRAIGDAVWKPDAIEMNKGSPPEPFDEYLFNFNTWRATALAVREYHYRQLAEEKKKSEEKQALRYAEYLQHLDSPQWRRLRQKVMKRDTSRCEGCLDHEGPKTHPICQGCFDHEATEAHHMTYKHFGNEFLFELAAVCRECHERIHDQSLRRPADRLADDFFARHQDRL
jgi:hypothetical protein